MLRDELTIKCYTINKTYDDSHNTPCYISAQRNDFKITRFLATPL